MSRTVTQTGVAPISSVVSSRMTASDSNSNRLSAPMISSGCCRAACVLDSNSNRHLAAMTSSVVDRRVYWTVTQSNRHFAPMISSGCCRAACVLDRNSCRDFRYPHQYLFCCTVMCILDSNSNRYFTSMSSVVECPVSCYSFLD